MKIDLLLTPVRLDKFDVDDKTVAVIDVLRCTTSICSMFRAGAKAVIPTTGPGEAGEMWSKIGSDSAVLAGERDGVKIENFMLGNSPLEFNADNVGGKYVITSTTNGTPVFSGVSKAALVLTCALVNISVVARRVHDEGRDLMIVCSGREGGFSIEDTICGGMLIDRLQSEYGNSVGLNDAASLACLLYGENRETIHSAIEQGEHGVFLRSIGFDDDIKMAADVDAVPILSLLRDGCLVREEV
jgi:2-phosphosulfolactate phosphatase